MLNLTVNDAVSQALAEEMRRDPRVLMFGEGVATTRQDLVAEFGPARVRNTPLAEAIIAGTAAGAAAMGLRPVIDLLYAPFLTLSMDAIINSAGKLRYLSGGQFAFPMVVLARTGAGWSVGAQHNHNLEAMFVQAPGLKVVMPSSAADFKGLLKSAIRDDNPVMFFMDMTLGYTPGPVPEGEHAVPLGQAAVLRPGRDVTLASYSKTVGHCLTAARGLAELGVDAEVIDLRTLWPWDRETVLASCAKTKRLLVAHEAIQAAGFGAEIAATAAETLGIAVRRLGAPRVPVGYSKPLEDEARVGTDRILAAIDALAAVGGRHRSAARG